MFVALAGGSQAYFACRANELTRDALDRSASQHKEVIRQAKELNDDTLTESRRMATKGIEAQERLASSQMDAGNELNAQQISLQREAMRLERRAWVAAQGIVNPTIESGKPLSFTVPISNSGATPGHIAQVRVQTRTLAADAAFVASYDPTESGSAMVIQPGMNVGVIRSGTQTLTQEHIAVLKSGSVRVYVFGEITYRDIFSRSHRTTFCQWLDKDFLFKWCSTYNEAD